MPIMQHRLLILAIIIGLMVVSACSSATVTTPIAGTSKPESETKTTGPTTPGSSRALSVDAFADILAKDKSQYTIVNVHIPYEGEIEGTDMKVPYNDLNALLAALPDRNARIILYCRSGRMSEIARRALLDKGYTQVWDLQGGMIAWQGSGRPIIDK